MSPTCRIFAPPTPTLRANPFPPSACATAPPRIRPASQAQKRNRRPLMPLYEVATVPPRRRFVSLTKITACPAGRAHYAWGGHFVTRLPCGGERRVLGLPLVRIII